MRRSVTLKDITMFAELDMIYNQVRLIEAKQNQTAYKCLGSGKCCSIGLTIHMAECAHIAFRLRQQYYLYMEDKGTEYADEWMDSVIDSLKEAMHDEDWQPGGETKRKCAFYKDGCTIYGFRPMVCRSFGTITTVDDYCPRIRNEYGHIDFYSGEGVKRVILDFQNYLKRYSANHEWNHDLVVYMPLGVLSFLLPTEELVELEKTTDPKFWSGVQGWYNYRVEFTKLHGMDDDQLKEEASKVNGALAF
jgi:Fe-S-cluster containining protein